MGTLTTDVAKAIRESRSGRLDYRLGRDGCIRGALGRAGQGGGALAANAGALVASLLENR
jgi:large subunit ribosomal protein L1